MARKIFISYRRDDTSRMALAIASNLALKFGKRNIYLDLDTRLGNKFPKRLTAYLRRSKAVVTLIGPRWLTPRLFQDGDWVRLELAQALSRHIAVIPVLVDGARLPTKAELPED